MSDDSLSTSEVEIEPPEFIDKREEAEAAFWRLKRAVSYTHLTLPTNGTV